MDREAGIEAYQALITAEEYQERAAAGTLEPFLHRYTADGDSPVDQVIITKAEKMATDVIKYSFSAVDGRPLPQWQAGAHLIS